MTQLAFSTAEQRDYLEEWINSPDPADPPRIIEGDGREIMPRFPEDSFDLILTSPPYPRAQRKPEDLGRYRRFVGADGSLLPEVDDIPHVRRKTQRLLRQADLEDAGRSPHASKKLQREFGEGRSELTGFKHGKPNLVGETGLQVYIHPDEWWPWFEPFAREMLRVIKPGCPLLLNVGGVTCPSWNHHTYSWDLPSQMKALGWTFVAPIYWAKPNGPPVTAQGAITNVVEHVFWFAKGIGGNTKPIWNPWAISSHPQGDGPGQVKRPIVRNVFDMAVGRTRWPEGQAHFACFPEAMAERMLTGWSHEGDLVLDPFAGSCTSLLAAKKLGRRSVMIELNPEGEIDCALARYEQEFGSHSDSASKAGG